MDSPKRKTNLIYWFPAEQCIFKIEPGYDQQRVKSISTTPRIYFHPNFLSDEECQYIIQQGEETGLQESLVLTGKSSHRTSSGVSLNSTENTILQEIEERIAVWTHIPAEHGEPLYILKYTEGQEYKPHSDFFSPTHPVFSKLLELSGQRVATVLMYLAAPELGGETTFPKANVTIRPEKGSAVLFWSVTNDNTVDINSIHGSLPVVNGTKYCLTKWIREKKFIPLPPKRPDEQLIL